MVSLKQIKQTFSECESPTLPKINTHEFLCLHSIRSMELVEETEFI